MFAQRVLNAQPSATKAMTAKARALVASGIDVITLSQGEPDFETPANIRRAGVRAIEDGRTRYTPVAGVEPLRVAIRQKLLRDNGLAYDISQITVGCGAKQVIFNALFATLNPGDEVIVPAPCWVSYPEMVKLAGGATVIVNTDRAAGFKLTPEQLEAAISPRTKWLLLNSPNNPTGEVYASREIAVLAEVLRQHPHVWVLTDDIYEKLVYEPAKFSTMAHVAPDLTERILIINGVSKANCMTGWRVGYGAGPVKLIAAMNLVQGQTSSHTSSIAQYAAIEAIDGDQGYILEMRDCLRVRRDTVVAALSNANGLQCLPPSGAFYVFPHCADLLGRSSPTGRRIATNDDFAMYLLEEANVAVVAGSSFLAEGHVRISNASADDDLARVCERIVDACERLR